MKRIFEQGEFSRYEVIDIRKSMGAINESVYYSQTTTVFISHKHDDLSDLKGLIGILEN